jgi:hypothetical protein
VCAGAASTVQLQLPPPARKGWSEHVAWGSFRSQHRQRTAEIVPGSDLAQQERPAARCRRCQASWPLLRRLLAVCRCAVCTCPAGPAPATTRPLTSTRPLTTARPHCRRQQQVAKQQQQEGSQAAAPARVAHLYRSSLEGAALRFLSPLSPLSPSPSSSSLSPLCWSWPRKNLSTASMMRGDLWKAAEAAGRRAASAGAGGGGRGCGVGGGGRHRRHLRRPWLCNCRRSELPAAPGQPQPQLQQQPGPGRRHRAAQAAGQAPRTDDVDGACVAPAVGAPELSEHAQRLLGHGLVVVLRGTGWGGAGWAEGQCGGLVRCRQVTRLRAQVPPWGRRRLDAVAADGTPRL